MTTVSALHRPSIASPIPALRRPMLWAGIVAGPLFVASAGLQMLTRPGFDLTRHAISLLSLGDFGWLQVATFLTSGALVIAASPAMRSVVRGRSGAIAAIGLVLYGGGLILAGVFTADPAYGFPVGAPSGPGEISWHGALHGVGFLLAQLGVMTAGVALAVAYRHRAGWSIVLIAAVIAVPVIIAVPAPIGFGIRAALVTLVTWTWSTAVSIDLIRRRRTAAEAGR